MSVVNRTVKISLIWLFVQTDLLIFKSTPNIKWLTVKLFHIFNLSLIRKIISVFLALVQSKLEQFVLKTYKLSEQQINPKVLSVTNSCHYNENSKMAKIVCRQIGCKSPRVGANVWCKSSRVRGGGGGGGGIVIDEIDTCVRSFMSELNKSFHDRSSLRPISSCWKLEWRCNDLLSCQ